MSDNRAPNTEYIVEAAGLTKIFKDFWLRAKATAVPVSVAISTPVRLSGKSPL